MFYPVFKLAKNRKNRKKYILLMGIHSSYTIIFQIVKSFIIQNRQKLLAFCKNPFVFVVEKGKPVVSASVR